MSSDNAPTGPVSRAVRKSSAMCQLYASSVSSVCTVSVAAPPSMFFGAASVSGFEEMGESDNLVFCVSWLESCVKVCVLVEDCKEPSEAGDGLQHVTHTHTGSRQRCGDTSCRCLQRTRTRWCTDRAHSAHGYVEIPVLLHAQSPSAPDGFLSRLTVGDAPRRSSGAPCGRIEALLLRCATLSRLAGNARGCVVCGAPRAPHTALRYSSDGAPSACCLTFCTP